MSWSERHLNWTLFLVWVLAPLVSLLPATIIGLANTALITPIAILVTVGLIGWTTWWYLRQKNRDTGNVFWIIVPFGLILLLCMKNLSKKQPSPTPTTESQEEYKHSVWEIYRKEWETASNEKRTELNKRMNRWQELMKGGLTASQAYIRVMQGESDETPQPIPAEKKTKTKTRQPSALVECETMRTPEEEVTQGNIAAYVKYLVERAGAAAPKSVFNRPAVILHLVFGLLFSPLVLIQGISTLVLGCLPSILLFPFEIIWWILLGLLLASGWLWDNACILRPILLLPMVFIAELSDTYVAHMPSMGDWQSRGIKLAICESWPHSLSIFRGRVK